MKIRIQRCNKFHYAEKLGHSAKGSKGLRYCVFTWEWGCCCVHYAQVISFPFLRLNLEVQIRRNLRHVQHFYILSGNFMTLIIKKYSNRRLYNTEKSCYITIADVRDLVLNNVDFKVVDANTDEDLTRSTLLQIILEQENSGDSIFTTEILSKIIRFYDDSVQNVFTSYLEQSVNLFEEQQHRLQKQVKEMLDQSSLDTFSDLTNRNLKVWQEMQNNFFKAAGFNPDSDKNPKK